MGSYRIAHTRVDDKMVWVLVKMTDETLVRDAGYFCGFYCNTIYANVQVLAYSDENTGEPYKLTNPHYRDCNWPISLENDYQGIPDLSTETDEMAYAEFCEYVNKDLKNKNNPPKTVVVQKPQKKKKKKWWLRR